MTTPSPRRTGRAEGVVQVLILLAIGSCAAAASFTHVHNVAAAHGQPGWLAWADAVVLELMSIATGLEIRRRHRTGQPAGFVLAVLIAAVALSLAAQVVEAERSAIGWLAAALPALGFLACIKIVLGRTSIIDDRPAPPATVPDRPITPDTVPAEVGQLLPVRVTPPLPAGLLDRARQLAAAHTETTGRDITRDELRDALRVSNALAGDVLRALRADTSASVSVNGYAGGGRW
jgi:hypothetical protein